MRTTGIAELKAKLSEYLASVKAGNEVLITERGAPIARISPLPDTVASEAGIEELERKGLIRRPTKPLGKEFWDRPRPVDPGDSVLKNLLEEREEGW